MNEVLMGAGYRVRVLNLGLPDRLLDHATQQEQLQDAGLYVSSIITAMQQVSEETSQKIGISALAESPCSAKQALG